MRRLAVVGVLAGAVFLVARMRHLRLGERLMAHCEEMFEHMPDTSPPKRMMRGIEETRANTARILEVLEATTEGEAAPRFAQASSS